VAGRTQSTGFPTSVGAFQASLATPDSDGFVARFDATGSTLLYSTYLGGSKYDSIQALAVDAAGHATVAGTTTSSNFPTVGPAGTSYFGGSSDAFVSRLDSTGENLSYSLYLGGSGFDHASGLRQTANGEAVVVGTTDSTDFSVTTGVIGPNGAGGQDGFLSRIRSDGGELLVSTYLGGSGDDSADAVALDASGNAVVVGLTNSTDFPTTTDALAASLKAPRDAFVSQISANGARLGYSTYLGGQSSDYASGVVAFPGGRSG
jgi:hypothetical protein